MLREGVDVMVATVGRAVTLLEREALDLSAVETVVLDEVDVMVLDESFPLQVCNTANPRVKDLIGKRKGRCAPLALGLS